MTDSQPDIREKVLVTGANGMVGKAVCEFLENRNIEVVGAVRSSRDKNRPEIGNIDAGTDWRRLLDGVTTVVHTAARVHKMHEPRHEIENRYKSVNTDASLSLARQADAAGVRRFIFLSTVKVLGENSVPGRPFTESSILSPADAYSRSKADAEKGLRDIAESGDMEIVIIRPPLVYGPNVKGNFQKMLTWIDRGYPLPLAGIENKRSMVGLTNLADFVYTCMRHPQAGNQVFLVADNHDLSTTEIARKIGEALRKPARLFYVPRVLVKGIARVTGKNSITDRLYGWLQLDISRTSRLLGWSPPLSVEEELLQTVTWMKQIGHSAN